MHAPGGGGRLALPLPPTAPLAAVGAGLRLILILQNEAPESIGICANALGLELARRLLQLVVQLRLAGGGRARGGCGGEQEEREERERGRAGSRAVDSSRRYRCI